jgi:hypothetical protein
MSQTPRICVICNENSGRNSREAQAIQTAMAVLGPGALLRQVKGEDLDDAAREAVAQDFDAIVAAGGDGTIMTVAGTLMDQGQRFGVLPFGTFNYFARGLGIPEDPKGAAEVILRGATRRVSLAEVNGQIFLNNISLGIYPAILRTREDVYAAGDGGAWRRIGRPPRPFSSSSGRSSSPSAPTATRCACARRSSSWRVRPISSKALDWRERIAWRRDALPSSSRRIPGEWACSTRLFDL